jgi:polysaccharide export outer membrane protein
MKRCVLSNSTTLLSKAIFVALALMVAAFNATAQVPVQSGSVRSVVNDNYRIGPGDLIDVVVSKNDTLSRTGLRVSNLGTIQLAMMDTDFEAACLTERQLADAIKEKYRKFLVDPFVNVAVRESNSYPVAVLGAVNSPGRFQMQRQVRLIELLTFVNGLGPNAGSHVNIIRNTSRPYCSEGRLVIPSDGGEELISLSLPKVLQGGEQNNPLIVAGDIVSVAPADVVNAYIQGNVRSAAVINLKEPVTLTQAIAIAGGTSEGAQLDKVTIRRQIEGSINREVLLINVKEIKQGKRDDVLILPNDIIEVPGPTGVRKVFQDIFRSIVPSITNLPTRVIL